jgi:UDP-N-acetylglucosamine--N-acetylmuramyl-(pentapeptide) pyrophosphoryl-undecaprenol N-acetylglucosamine transferase
MKRGEQQRIVLVGGGTGGHFYPLIAVAERLNETKQTGASISLYYFGPDPYSQAVLTEHDIAFVRIPAGKRRKYFSPLNFIDPFKTLYGVFVAIFKLYFIYPDAIFSKGGFTSVPVVLAAWLLRIPIMIHESDSKAGSANKLAAHFARYIAIAYDEAAQFFLKEKIALIGIPLRRSLMTPHPDPLTALNLPSDRPLLFVTGGSLGSQRINNLILESLDELLPYFSIVHQTGPTNEAYVRTTAVELIRDQELLKNYLAKGTLTAEEMHLALSGSSFIISRAGSGSIFEIAHTGKPSIIIPIPEDISHDQRTNAYAYARTGAATVLEEGNLTDSLLVAEITRIMTDETLYAQMSAAAKAFARHDAADVIARTLLEIAQEHV